MTLEEARLRRLALLKGKLDTALNALSDFLQQELIDAVRAESLIRKDKKISACSAMGTWSCYQVSEGEHTADKALSLRVFNLFSDLQRDYGWNVIPAPLLVEALNGKVEAKTDW
jgi:hypothetical protein